VSLSLAHGFTGIFRCGRGSNVIFLDFEVFVLFRIYNRVSGEALFDDSGNRALAIEEAGYLTPVHVLLVRLNFCAIFASQDKNCAQSAAEIRLARISVSVFLIVLML